MGDLSDCDSRLSSNSLSGARSASRRNTALRYSLFPIPCSLFFHLPNCFTKKSAIMWLASSASGSRGLYQKACVSASKTTR
jgi:hypothetical protein